MKKTIVIFILFASAIFLQSVTFEKYYHSNYGIIERIVLVFYKKPVKVIEQNNKQILITISDCRKFPSIEEKQVLDNPVLEYFRFMEKANDVIVIISLDTNYFLDKLEYFDKEVQVYKIVLDVFNTKNPQTPEEHMSFADYYGALGKKDKAEFHTRRALEIEKEMLEKEMVESTFVESIVSTTDTTEIQDTTLIMQPQESDTLGVELIDEEKREITFIKLLLIVLLVLFLYFFIRFIIKFARIGRRKKSEEEQKLEEEEKDYRSYDGFGSEEFKEKMIFKLIDKDWETEEIAKEMNLTPEEVIRLRSGKKKVIKEVEESEEDKKRDEEETSDNDEVIEKEKASDGKEEIEENKKNDKDDE